MKWLIFLITLLIITVLAGQQALEDPGYVLIAYREWKLETTVTLLLVILLAAGALSYFMIRTLLGLWSAPKRLANWKRQKNQEKAETSLNKGLVAMFEGNWKQAEKLLLKKSKPSHTPLLNYLAAAKAAQEQGNLEQRDTYLKSAYQADSSAEVAVGLTQARLQLEQGQNEQALATLERLRRLAPKHRYVLQLLAESYEKLGEWHRLEDLLPTLRRADVLDENALFELTQRCYKQLLINYGSKDDFAALHQLWRRMPRRMHQDVEVIRHYIEALINKGQLDEAEVILKSSLSQNWDGLLVTRYGQLESRNASNQLVQAERWLSAHPNDPHLLLALGRICKRNELWGKARDYLEQGVGSGMVDIYQELISLLESMGEDEEAQCYYRQGLSHKTDL
jgi:HemY protein